jgi:hypothetical protein
VKDIRLEPLSDCEFQPTPYGEVNNPLPELTRGAPFFIFAAGDYGDGIVLDSNGRVILADHEGPMQVLADSLAGWIERLIAFKGTEYAYIRGQISDLPSDRARVFLTDHRRLNPEDEWAARQLMGLDYPNGHPLGPHVWDHESHRLFPIAQAPAAAVRDIHLSDVTQRDIENVLGAKGCTNLMVIGAGPSVDFSVLAKLSTLTDLYLYDVKEIDARQLSGHPALDDVCFLRCRVAHVDALAKIASLKRLRLNECHVDETELAHFRSLRPEVKLE